ncbi:MAG: hypothetical protein NC204_04495 [Candidatus Amulumruptor caecigallinarius]|nr:hypothetical protein [Candidatus Amulumruptor caecigallinarius]
MKYKKIIDNIEHFIACFNADGQENVIGIETEKLREIFDESEAAGVIVSEGNDLSSVLSRIDADLFESNFAHNIVLLLRTAQPSNFCMNDMGILQSFIQSNSPKDCNVTWGVSSLKSHENAIAVIIACLKPVECF